jgi:hypothetical protein
MVINSTHFNIQWGKGMDFLPDICQVPYILRERKINPVDFYTHSEINWSKQQYNAYAKNRRKMSAGQMKKVGHFLGIPIDDVYTWKVKPPRKGTGNKQSRK